MPAKISTEPQRTFPPSRSPLNTNEKRAANTGSSHTAYTARAVDISSSGARLQTGIDLQTGQHLTIVRKNGITQTVPSQVVWAAAKGTKQSHLVGVVFLQPMQV